jgi:hypothetical protein
MHSGTDFDEELVLMEAGIFAKRAEEINRKIMARQKADAFLVPLAFAGAFALIASSFIFSAIPNSNRTAKVEQEYISYANR